MEVAVVKEKEKISLYIDKKERVFTEPYCYILGNLYNIDTLGHFSEGLSLEQKLIKLYTLYKDKLFSQLNGEFALILIIDHTIIIVRDRMGCKQLYYTLQNDIFICSNSFAYLQTYCPQKLVIDKQEVANFLRYSYIQAPFTIFKDVYKLESGSFVRYKNQTLLVKKYYNLLKQYMHYRSRLLRPKSVENTLTRCLEDAIERRIAGKNKIGICFSAGIDSPLLASLIRKDPKREIHAYTIGFYDEKRNEAERAKKISNYLSLVFHEYYIDDSMAKELVHGLVKIYTEPLADPSMIPTTLLYQKIDPSIEVVITGDGADQLFCGSTVYDSAYRRNLITIAKIFIKNIFWKKGRYHNIKKEIHDIYGGRRKEAMEFIDIEPECYYNLPWVPIKEQIKYMIFDIKTYLANNLFSKVSFPAMYYHTSIVHPFIDNDFVKNTFKVAHKYKYRKNKRKYILKKMAYKRVPKKLFNDQKQGFGIPLDPWLYTVYKEDIIHFCNEEALQKQNIFEIDKIKNVVQKLERKTLSSREEYTLFAYYMFQLWYQEYIEDLWK